MVMDRIEFFALIAYAAYLFGTGAVIVMLAGVRRNFFVLSYGISISLLVITQLLARSLGSSIASWWALLHILLLVSAGFSLVIRYFGGWKRVTPGRNFDIPQVVGWTSVIVPFAVYHWVVGPYTEVPSDFWSHLGVVKEQLSIIERGSLGGLSDNWIDVIRHGTAVPFFHGVIADNLGVLPIMLVRSATLVSSVIILTTIYWFTLRIIRDLGLSEWMAVGAACVAAVLFVVGFGVSSFSYIRYYAYFPHLLNLSLVFIIVGLYVDYLGHRETNKSILAVIGMFLATVVLINEQEFLFALVLLLSVSIWRFTRAFVSKEAWHKVLLVRSRVMGLLAIAVSLVGLGAGFLLFESGDWGRPHIIDLGRVNEIFRGLPIANPSLRFWDTLGLHGVVIYCWYLFYWAKFARADYINVAMFSPLITLLNPIFVLWFLHVGSWDSLWRLAYLMPVPIAGGILVGLTVQDIVKWKGHSKSLPGGLFLVAAVVTLMPFETALISNDNSRFPSLARLEQSNGALLWGDLIEAVEVIEGERILITDNITNYVLSSATKHGGKGEPKERWQQRRGLFGGDYKKRLLYYGVDDSLLIINQRDGSLSETGRISGHWWSDVLKVSQLYPRDLVQFVEGRPEDFQKMWNNNNIVVYEVLRDPTHY